MSICAFGYQNSVLTGLLSAGSAALPVVNLATQLGSSATAWQTASGVVTSAAGAWVRGNATLYNTAFGAFSIHRTNMTGSSTFRARVWSDQYSTLVWDSGTLATGMLSGYGQALILPPAGTFGQYWQLDFDDPGSPDGFINIPLMYVGPLFSPTVGMSANSQNQTVLGNVQNTTKYGQVYVSSYWQARQATPALGYLKDAEMSAMFALDAVCRTGANILFIPDTSSAGYATRDAIFGLCTSGAYTYSFAHRDARAWAGQITERI
jgi:hypothetical protein